MTIRIPAQFIAFVVYTVALLGGAFGISYAVFEWRDDEVESDGTITLESLDNRIDRLDGQITSLSSRVGNVSLASGSTDSRQCHRALADLSIAVAEGITQGLGLSLTEKIRQVEADFNLYC